MFIYNNGSYSFVHGDDPKIIYQIPSGIYDIQYNMGGMSLSPVDFTGDDIVRIDTIVEQMVRREVSDFFDTNITHILDNAGVKHRRGILLHGQVGCGKTTLVRSLIPKMINNGAIVLSEPDVSSLSSLVIPAIRKSDPDRPVVCIWDEFDEVVFNYEDEIIRLLDGVRSPDHIMFVATTNDISGISDKLTKRPSRFSLVLEVGMLSLENRILYASSKYDMLDADDILFVSGLTDDLSIDITEEACKLILTGYSRQEVSDRLIFSGHLSN
jgi:SpoVK/Ycf46/Vps4 family AAA+-type ATPase